TAEEAVFPKLFNLSLNEPLPQLWDLLTSLLSKATTYSLNLIWQLHHLFHLIEELIVVPATPTRKCLAESAFGDKRARSREPIWRLSIHDAISRRSCRR